MEKSMTSILGSGFGIPNVAKKRIQNKMKHQKICGTTTSARENDKFLLVPSKMIAVGKIFPD